MVVPFPPAIGMAGYPYHAPLGHCSSRLLLLAKFEYITAAYSFLLAKMNNEQAVLYLEDLVIFMLEKTKR